jgi:fructose-1,6-bisphosphatase/inositol monophosphatase family enzyme
MTRPATDAADRALARAWRGRLAELAARIRRACRDAAERAPAQLDRPVGEGAGDVTFGLDEVAEAVLVEWLLERAREGPVSLLTEDAGWRHRGPAPGAPAGAEPVELAGFDHGGPRIAVDPVDGTRHLMHDMRSAWTSIALAGPGAGVPRFRELALGLVSELPDARAARYRCLCAVVGEGCEVELRDLASDRVLRAGALRADTDDRVDHGYFPFFAFHPETRPEVGRLAADFFARLAAEEGAALEHCYDDQYICNVGQLVLLALGTYRLIVDPRAWLAARRGRTTQSSHPYDLAAAALCAREAGCGVTAIDGAPLDFPLDTSTPVSFVGFANGATRARLAPHLARALASFVPG